MSIRERVVIPALVALVTGLLFAAAVLSYSLIMGGNAAWALLIGSVVALVTWIVRPQPGGLHIPRPVAPVQVQAVRVEIRGDEGRSMDYLNLGIDRNRLEQLAQGLVAGKKLDVRTWTGRGGLFSGSEFTTLRTELISRGIVRWNSDRDSRGGVSLTAKGQAIFRALAALPSPDMI